MAIGDPNAKVSSVTDNILHQFASYNTLFTLSGISQQDIDTRSFLENPLKNIIARSGGIGPGGVDGTVEAQIDNTGSINDILRKFGQKRNDPFYVESIDILSRGHDIFFENVNITSVPGPNNERNLADLTKMEFELHEPYGVTFIEKIRAAAFLEGFKDYQAAPFLLTIEFVGYDNLGKQSKVTVPKRKIPIFITRVEFEVNEGGARYTAVAVPFQDMAYDDSFKFTRTLIQVNTDRLSAWQIVVANSLNNTMMKQEEEHNPPLRTAGFRDRYKFEIHKDLKDLIQDKIFVRDASIFRTDTVAQQVKKDTEKLGKAPEQDEPLDEFEELVQIGGYGTIEPPTPKQKSLGITITPGTSIVKAFEDVLKQTVYFQNLVENFWSTYLSKNLGREYTNEQAERIISTPQYRQRLEEAFSKQPYVTWFKIKPNIRVLSEDVDPITKMQPKEITYTAVPHNISIYKFLMPGQQISNKDLERSAVKRYNYIYTGDNVDIQSLRIFYKTAYYMRNIRGEAKTDNEDGVFEIPKKVVKRLFNVSESESAQRILNLRSYPSLLKSRNTAEKISPAQAKNDEFFDYLTNPQADMMRIELEILGDPAFLSQDAFTPLGSTPNEYVGEKGRLYSTKFECYNTDQFMPVIFLKYRLPTDVNENKGTMFFDSNTVEQTTFFTGAYQVARIESSINQGQFIQTLTCVRLNNQGEGSQASTRRSVYDRSGGGLANENLPSKKTSFEDRKKFRHGINRTGKSTSFNESLDVGTPIKKNDSAKTNRKKTPPKSTKFNNFLNFGGSSKKNDAAKNRNKR